MARLRYLSNKRTGDAGTVCTGDFDITGDLDITGNINVTGSYTYGSGTLPINQNLQGTFTVGQDGTGYDVIFYGAGGSKYWLWDASANGVVLVGSMDITGDITVTEGTYTTTYPIVFSAGTADLAGITYGTLGTPLSVAVASSTVLYPIQINIETTGTGTGLTCPIIAGNKAKTDNQVRSVRGITAWADFSVNVANACAATFNVTRTGAKTVTGEVYGVCTTVDMGSDTTSTGTGIYAYRGYLKATGNTTDKPGSLVNGIMMVNQCKSDAIAYFESSVGSTYGINLNNAVGTMTSGIRIFNAGTLTNAIYISGTMTTGLNIDTGCTTGIAIAAASTTGISIGAAGTANIAISGTNATGIAFTGTYSTATISCGVTGTPLSFADNADINVAIYSTFTGDEAFFRGLYVRSDYTPATSGEASVYGIRGHAYLTSGQTHDADYSTDESFCGIHGLVTTAGIFDGAGLTVAGLKGEVTGGGTYTEVKVITGVWSKCTTTTSVGTGVYTGLYVYAPSTEASALHSAMHCWGYINTGINFKGARPLNHVFTFQADRGIASSAGGAASKWIKVQCDATTYKIALYDDS